MNSVLSINLDNLLRQRTIEAGRTEYKIGWNPERVLHTICAFANDFHNLGGRYILKELELTEGRSTGIPKILRAMKKNGSPPPQFDSDEDRTYFLIRLPAHPKAAFRVFPPEAEVIPQVTPPVEKLALMIRDEMVRAEIMDALGLRDHMHFVHEYLQPALDRGLIEMTIPERPRSSRQRYRLSSLGQAWVRARKNPTPD